MKKLILTAILTLSAVSVLAQQTVTGSGAAGSGMPPGCDEDSYQAARLAADQDAVKQCGGSAIRISEYSTHCDLIAHGYAANAVAVATYSCQ